MATTIYPTVPVAQPEAELWPADKDPASIQADEIFARQLDTGFAGEIRALLYDPEAGLAGKGPEDALGGIAEAMPLLVELKDRYLAQAIGPRQKAILEPLIDTRLDRASGDLGRIAQQATTDLDDRSVAERIAGLHQDAAFAWHDPAQLRALGRAAMNELRYQGERRGWDETQTDTAVRQGLSDLYAGAVEQAIGQAPDRAAKLYAYARDVIKRERQVVVERKMERAREDRHVAAVVGSLADVSDDPTRRPDLADYQARAAELAPPDASPEVHAQVSRMAAIEHAHADRAWQADRGRAAMGALDWLTKNPVAPLLAMPTALRDGLSPEQTERLDAAAISGGRIRTVADLYGNLVRQAVADPEGFVSVQLDQHRLALSNVDYTRLTQWQRAIESGQRDDTLVRLGRALGKADSALRQAGYDLEGPDAKEVLAEIRNDVLEFDALEGRSASREDLDGIVARGVEPLVARQIITRDVESSPSDSTSEIVTATVPLTQLNAKPNGSNIDGDVTSWLMQSEPDGQWQTERPPSSIWNQLTYAQQQAVDILLTRNATASSGASAEIHLAANPPDAANENTRNYVCTQAVYACLSNTPSGAPPTWRESCLTAESLCNRIVNLSRGGPFSVEAVINFPDRSRVTVPKGSMGHGRFTPAPQIPQPPIQ